jgi:DUF4097 and DUF4098 domain-containing protein YvlB
VTVRRPILTVAGAALMLAGTAASAGAHIPRQEPPSRLVNDAGVLVGGWIDTTVSIAPGGVIDLELGSGEVILTGWSRKEVRLRAAAVNLRITSSLIAVRPDRDRGRGRGRDLVYEVSVPAGVRVMVRASEGSVTATGVKGDLELGVGRGDIQVTDIGGVVVAELMEGDFVGTRLARGARIDAVGADVQVIDATGDIVIDNTSGETILSDIRSSSVRVESINGEVSYYGTFAREGRYRFASHSGTVRLALPADISALVSLSTFSGTIDSQLPVTVEPGRRTNPEKHLTGRMGDASARIEIETFSGNIVIHRPRGDRED